MKCLLCSKELLFNKVRKHPFCTNLHKAQWLRESFEAGTLPAEYILVKKCPICLKNFETVKALNSQKMYCSTDCRFRRTPTLTLLSDHPTNFKRRNPKYTRPELCKTCSKYPVCLNKLAPVNKYIWPCEVKNNWDNYSPASKESEEEDLLSGALKRKLLGTP